MFIQATTGAPKPKRPLSAFFLFAAEHRPQVRKDLEKNTKEGVKVRVGDIAKKIGVMWKAVDADEKAKFQVSDNPRGFVFAWVRKASLGNLSIKTGSETGYLAQNLDRLHDRDFQGRILDRKA